MTKLKTNKTLIKERMTKIKKKIKPKRMDSEIL
jgi:hypothetical protein